MDSETRDAFERLATDLRAEIRSVDTGLRTFIGELATDLRAEIRSGDAETRAYVDASVATSAAETRVYVDASVTASAAETRAYVEASAAETRAYVAASEAETRRHFDVVAEALRGDIRSLAELMAISNERMEEGSTSTAVASPASRDGCSASRRASRRWKTAAHHLDHAGGDKPSGPSVPLHDLAERGAQVVARAPQVRMHGEGAPEEQGRLVELAQHQMAEALA